MLRLRPGSPFYLPTIGRWSQVQRYVLLAVPLPRTKGNCQQGLLFIMTYYEPWSKERESFHTFQFLNEQWLKGVIVLRITQTLRLILLQYHCPANSNSHQSKKHDGTRWRKVQCCHIPLQLSNNKNGLPLCLCLYSILLLVYSQA